MKKISYSWQSDIRKDRNFINNCLKKAVAQVGGWEIETATRDAQGAVDIAATILNKNRAVRPLPYRCKHY